MEKKKKNKGGKRKDGKPIVHKLQSHLAEVVAEDLAKPPAQRAKNKRELLMRAGYSPTSSSANTELALTSAGFIQALKNRGVTPEAISNVYNDALGAKIVTVFKGEARESEVPDHKIRMQSAAALTELTGIKKPDNVVAVQVNIGTEELKSMLNF